MDADWLWPLSAAVMDGLWLEVTVPVETWKVTLLCPELTVTLAGTVRAALLLLRETVRLPAADLFNETVHVAEALLPKLEGQVRAESWAGVDTLMLNVAEMPLALAVMVAVTSALAETLAENVA